MTLALDFEIMQLYLPPELLTLAIFFMFDFSLWLIYSFQSHLDWLNSATVLNVTRQRPLPWSLLLY